MNRRQFTRLSALTAPALLLQPYILKASVSGYKSNRPAVAKRRFVSDSVEALITEIKKNISDPEIAWMFENCFPNTLDTTVFYELKNGVPDTYVITGDIDAMWQRDSSAQVNPYLPLCKDDKHLSSMIEGVIRRQTRNILLDPYANAFYKDSHKISPWKSDNTDMKPGVHERKYELDSLCYCIRLAYQYWKITGNTSQFDEDWHKAMKLVVATMLEQQREQGKGSYHFVRRNTKQTDTLKGEGYGNPVKPTGMVCTAFRNSDDAAEFLFNIPENFFAVVALRQLSEILSATSDKDQLQPNCISLAKEIEEAVWKYGTKTQPEFGKILAYECDGLGNFALIEDAGIPGLVTIPYLGYTMSDESYYTRTRAFALSPANPYFFKSDIAEGVGSPHLDWKGNMIWPMGIISRAITSNSDQEISHCLKMLKDTQAGTGFMHEGFKKDNPSNFTRHWFAWANSFFGEMVWNVYRERRSLLQI